MKQSSNKNNNIRIGRKLIDKHRVFDTYANKRAKRSKNGEFLVSLVW